MVLGSVCVAVAEMDGQLSDLGCLEALSGSVKSAVWQCALRAPPPICPVPLGILKAIEVELDLVLRRDVVIHVATTET